MPTNTIINAIYEQVQKRNAGEQEFLQAVKEVLDSLGPVLEKHPEYVDAKIVERIESRKDRSCSESLGRMTRETSRSTVDFVSNSTVHLAHTRAE